MIANLTRGAKTASLHLPADRFQIAGVLSYLGVDRLDDYELLCEGQDSSGIMVSLEPTGIAERNIAELCRNEKVSLGRLNSGLSAGQRQGRKPRQILQLRFYTKAWRCPSAELQVRFSWRCGRKSGRCLHAVQYTRASRNLPGTFTFGFGCD